MFFSHKLSKVIALGLIFCSVNTTFTNAATVGTITGDNVNVRSSSSTDSSVISKVNNGQTFNITGATDGWFKVSTSSGEAYVTNQFLKVTQTDGTVNSSNVNIRTAPNTTASVVGQVSTGTNLTVKGIAGDWYAVNYNNSTAYIYKDFITGSFLQYLPSVSAEPQAAQASSNKGSEIVNYAKQFIGTPYVYGGTNLKNGVDCSGFTYALYRDFGVTLNRCSKDQVANGSKIERTSLKDGDLVFFNTGGNSPISHVGMYIGNGQYIHSTDGKAYSVTISDLNNAYSSNTYVTACRIFN